MILTDLLQTLRYPGRFIVVGQSNKAVVALYGATGRSAASLARKYIQKGSDIYAVAVDDTVKKEGNPALLEYRALHMLKTGFVVANGTQGDKIGSFTSLGAMENLSLALNTETYEPDQYQTPRITAGVSFVADAPDIALGSIRAGRGGTERMFWRIKLEEGKGKYLATYTGEDVRPVPSFSGDPVDVEFAFKSATEAAQQTFAALAPPQGQPDYRVGVVALALQGMSQHEVVVVNRLP